MKCPRRSGVSMIVTPASLVYNWREEFRRFAPELKIRTVTGTAGTRRDVIEAVNKENRDVDVLITSYDLLKRDIDAYENAEFRFVLRRLKQDVLKELPEKLEEIQYTSMESRQHRSESGRGGYRDPL